MPIRKIALDLLTTLFVLLFLIVPFGAFETVTEGAGLHVNFRWRECLLVIACMVVARFLWLVIAPALPEFKFTMPANIGTSKYKSLTVLSYLFIAIALILPLLPFADRRILDVSMLLLTYIMLGWGLSVVVGLVGLLDLGYIAFYAIGAYSYALLNMYFGLSFWICLPLAGAIAAVIAYIIGSPVLRLRGDYFAIVTLGFAEITRIILINWQSITKGPDGISSIPRPNFFGMADFNAVPPEGTYAFHQLLDLPFSPMHRIIFLYYIILSLALLTAWLVTRIIKLPIGRAFEALRENDIAAQSLGINLQRIKISAYAFSGFIGGLAGAFFATKQGFISPESFTLMESIIILAIVVLGGTGHRIGVVLAAVILIGLPELFRELEQYRMIAFGAGLVIIMICRPQGLFAKREPTITLPVQS